MKLLKILLFAMAGQSVSWLWATPLPPGKVEGVRSSSGQSFTITWASPTFRTDGNLLAAGELASFKIIRTPTLTGGTMSVVFSIAIASPTTFTDTTVAGRIFFYAVRAVDSSARESANSASVSSDIQNTAYFIANDGNSFAGVPGTLKSSLDADGLALLGTRFSVTEGNRVYKSVNFDVVDSLTGQAQSNYVLASPATFGIGYLVDGTGQVVSGSEPLTPKTALSYPDAAGAKFAFSIFWNNGSDWIKLGTSVDTSNRVAATQSRLLGSYQLRLVSQNLSAQLNSVYPRSISPNNDGINDRVFFLFENPSDSAASGTIFDIQSAKVSDLRTTDLFGGDTVLFWDGTDDNGAAVAGGIYLYKIEIDNKKFSGTVTVAR